MKKTYLIVILSILAFATTANAQTNEDKPCNVCSAYTVIQSQASVAKTEKTPIAVAAKDIKWMYEPNLRIDGSDLLHIDFKIESIFDLQVNELGRVKAQVSKSTGIERVDAEIIRALNVARIYPVCENGTPTPFSTTYSVMILPP